MSERTDRLREWLGVLPVNLQAAREATKLAVVTVVVLWVLQMGVTAAVTAGDQPVGSVDTVPVEPQSATWEDAPETTVQLNQQQMVTPYGGGSVGEVTVNTVTNESHIAVRMEWTDPTYDANIGSPENYSDAAAVMFGTGDIPPIMMGAVENPVNIWYWRASWENNRSAYGSGGMYGYPNAEAGSPTQPGKAVGNSLSVRYDERGAQNLYAEGYGSTSDAPSQPVQASAERTEDGWAVTFTRERVTEGEYDAAFNGEKDVYVAFAVWNGSADERNGQKSITLQYRKLDLSSGELVDTDSSSGDGSDGSEGGDGTEGGDGSSGGPSAPDLSGWLGILVGAVLMVWLVSYYRMR